MKYMIESREIITDIYPFRKPLQCAKINQTIEYIVEVFRGASLEISTKGVLFPLFEISQELEEEEYEHYKENLQNALEKIDLFLSKRDPYLLGQKLTLVGFYLLIGI